MGDWFAVGFAVFLLALNAFFVGAEFALISVRRDRLESLVAQGKRSAKTVLSATEDLSLMLAASQLGITIASILLGKVGEPAIAHLIEAPMSYLSVPAELLHPISFVIALMIVSVLHILLGEMVPKNIALAGPEASAMVLVPSFLIFVKLTRPLIGAFNWMANHTLRAFGVEPRDELDSSFTPSELAAMITESRDEGFLDAEESLRLSKALATSHRTLQEVMVPTEKVRTVMATADGSVAVAAVEEAVRTTGFSRFPVRNARGGYVGYIHIKDVLSQLITGDETRRIETSEIRSLPAVPLGLTLDKVLTRMRKNNAHLAKVVDDTTGTIQGIVAMEDVIEEYVGTVRDATHRPPTAS